MTEAVVLVPLFPALGVLLNLIFSRRMSEAAVGIMACASVGASFLSAVVAVFGLSQMEAGHRAVETILYQWIGSGKFSADVGFLLDPLSSVMILVVTGVAFLIHVYSIGYMHGDPGVRRFFLYMNLFVFAMLLLVLGNSYVILFVGWEGVGLCSYLLIGFWYVKDSAANAGQKAFVVNRIGDFGFLLGMLLIIFNFGTLSFTKVFAEAPHVFNSGDFMVTLITLLMFLGATGKSAQLPLYIWLPDAMEGPTPVSALIHAATMVTAGVYMICRSHVLYDLAPASLVVVATVGCLTAFLAGTIALVQNDIKRVLAYSTVSQLGYMMLAAGVGAYTAAIFHLMTHAFFKALLFLGAGSVIHALHEEQDIRNMGGLRKIMPTTYKTFLIASLAIAGIPPLAGFMSKDEILYSTFNAGMGGWNTILWSLGIFTAFLTAFYMFRLVFKTFHGECRLDPERKKHAHESPPVVTIPLVALAFLSAVGGFLGIPIFLKYNVMHNWMGPLFAKVAQHGGEAAHAAHSLFAELSLMGISVVVATSGILLALIIILFRPGIAESIRQNYSGLYNLFLNKWWVDEMYNAVVIRPLWALSGFFWTEFDGKGIDGTLHGIANGAQVSGGWLSRLQTGFIQNYALTMAIGVAVIMILALF